MMEVKLFQLDNQRRQCPGKLEINPVTTCEGMTNHGPAVYVDFYRINHPCTCIVTPLFVGELLVTSREVILKECYTRVIVKTFKSYDIIFGCPVGTFSSQTLKAQVNQSVDVRAEYISPFTSGRFYHCLSFQQNGIDVYFSIFDKNS